MFTTPFTLNAASRCVLTSVMLWATASSGLAVAPPAQRCGLSAGERDDLQSECMGRVAERVTIAQCPSSICIDRERVEALVSLTDLDDRVVEAGSFERATRRLKETGYFKDAIIACQPSGGGVAVSIAVCPNRVVRTVQISGNRYFREREIRKRVFLRPGQVLDADPKRPDENEDIQRQTLALQRLYAREGVALNGPPRVTLQDSGDIYLDVMITLDEANREGVRDVQGRHIQELRQSGRQQSCPDVDPDTIEALTEVSSGDIVSQRDLKRARKRLEKWFRSIGFVSPRADVQVITNDEGVATLLAEVMTSHCWEIRIWERDAATGTAEEPAFRFQDPVGQSIQGKDEAPFRRNPFETWRTILPFAESGVFDRSEAARGIAAIEGRLESQGFFFRKVSMQHREFPKGRGPLLGRIDYLITKNYERRLQKLMFPGRKSFDRETIDGVIKTRGYSFLSGGGTLQVAKVMDDLALLERLYKDRGFAQFRYLISSTKEGLQRRLVRDGGDMVWEYQLGNRGFRVRKPQGGTHLYLEVPLEEGPRTRVGNISLLRKRAEASGASTVTPWNMEELSKTLSLQEGKPFGTDDLKRDIRAIRSWHRKRGFHEVQVTTTCEAFEPEPMDGLCDLRQVKGTRVDLAFHVAEGRRFAVGEVFWRGNFKTDSSILVRDMPKPGEPFNADKVNDALRRMRQLGIFSSAKVDIIGLDESPPRSKVGLVVSVEEAPARYLDVSLSFRNIDRPEVGNVPPLLASVVGQSVATSDRLTTGLARPRAVSLPDLLLVFGLEYVDLNVLGLAQELRIPIEYGLSTLSPVRLARFAPTWTVPWRIGDQDLRVEWAATAVLSDQVTEIKDFSEFAGGVTITLPLPDRMVVAVELSGGANSFAEPDADVHPIEGPYDPFVRWAVRWRWDQQDNPLNPRKGWALNLQLSGVFATEIDAGLVELRDYVKWEVSARGAIDFSSFVLAGYLRYGGSTGDAVEPLPLRERYSLGGSNGMRGFADNAVGRYDKTGELLAIADGERLDTGGNVLLNMNLELRFPLIPDIWLWGVVFGDVGALAATHEAIYPSSFRVSAGVGLRLLLFDQIPVRLDFGFPVERRCAAYGSDGSATAKQVCVREDDSFNWHLNVLYPF